MNASQFPSSTNPIRVRFYGPVNWKPDTFKPPFAILRRANSGGPAVELSNYFTQELDPSDDSVVIVRPGSTFHTAGVLQRGYEYALVLVDDEEEGGLRLRSNVPQFEVIGDPAVHVFAVYEPSTPSFTGTPFSFRLCDSNASGDANDDGVVTFLDVTTVLSNFGCVGPCFTGDADRDNSVNFTDVSTVLANFGSTYCTSSVLRLTTGEPKHGPMRGHAANESGAIMSASTAAATLSSALLSMGYESIDAFVGTISQMSEADRNAEVRRLGELLEGGAGGVD